MRIFSGTTLPSHKSAKAELLIGPPYKGEISFDRWPSQLGQAVTPYQSKQSLALAKVKTPMLDELWKAGREEYSSFVTTIKSARGNQFKWHDNDGHRRTGSSKKIAHVLSKNTTVRNQAGVKEESKINSHYMYGSNPLILALKQHVSGDHKNFARIVASVPNDLIPALTDKKKALGKTAVFNETSIGIVIAELARQVALNSANYASNPRFATDAYIHFLKYYPIDSERPWLMRLMQPGNMNRHALITHIDSFMDALQIPLAPQDLGTQYLNTVCAAYKVGILYAAIAKYAQEVKESGQKDLDRLQMMIGLTFMVAKKAAVTGAGMVGAGEIAENCVDSAQQLIQWIVGKKKSFQPIDVAKELYRTMNEQILLPAHDGAVVPGVANRNLSAAREGTAEQEELRLRQRAGDYFIQQVKVTFATILGLAPTDFS